MDSVTIFTVKQIPLHLGDDVDKYIEISLLYDFYRELLSQRQKSIVEYYYNDNYSLGEIAEKINISRQGVFDTLKRGEELLYEYDKKLQLKDKYQSNSKLLNAAMDKVRCCIEQIPQDQKKILTTLTEVLEVLDGALKQI
ncbi:MAG: YlxM family DNA-binding protein [Eubacteriales bacterium]